MNLDAFPRIALFDAPTPIQRLERVENALGLKGARLFVKRDDLMGLGGGGNKLRKLEYLLGAAIAEDCDTFITTGARQSNHARLSAAAAARMGLKAELMLTDTVPREDPAYLHNGNQLLDGLFGAVVHHLPRGSDSLAAAQARAEILRAEGRKVYVVGSGGSSPVGALGYARCAAEIGAQESELGLRFSTVIVANGSHGTHAGLAAGIDDPRRVLSFTVLAELAEAERGTLALANETRALLGRAALEAEHLRIDGSQRGEAYGIPTEAMLAAVRLMARQEGLLIDPVYSGKAFAGVLAGLAGGSLTGDVLFVMTGGTPGLYAYQPAFG
ncbi:D-cysteine desulfhydrase family protein [Sphingomonas sp. NIBR02145]|uniref:D-cysteine desulfhydrase family protein n=1 Tax=Sphingomonas sp. NIBR02145 TaxID=3014784 RepID=UPI0022B2DCA3|nr:D-cysteine desulfhydrase family protein [Sphingomonas sp. NIBR02145]WHU01855.1 D-cysteine desulfhydrase family protein [Sphingomonas sp. NIBR02145]